MAAKFGWNNARLVEIETGTTKVKKTPYLKFIYDVDGKDFWQTFYEAIPRSQHNDDIADADFMADKTEIAILSVVGNFLKKEANQNLKADLTKAPFDKIVEEVLYHLEKDIPQKCSVWLEYEKEQRKDAKTRFLQIPNRIVSGGIVTWKQNLRGEYVDNARDDKDIAYEVFDENGEYDKWLSKSLWYMESPVAIPPKQSENRSNDRGNDRGSSRGSDRGSSRDSGRDTRRDDRGSDRGSDRSRDRNDRPARDERPAARDERPRRDTPPANNERSRRGSEDRPRNDAPREDTGSRSRRSSPREEAPSRERSSSRSRREEPDPDNFEQDGERMKQERLAREAKEIDEYDDDSDLPF